MFVVLFFLFGKWDYLCRIFFRSGFGVIVVLVFIDFLRMEGREFRV